MDVNMKNIFIVYFLTWIRLNNSCVKIFEKKSEFIRSSFRALTRWRSGVVKHNIEHTATKCRVYTVHEWLKITIFVLLESK
jgi:hypothetical protein